MPRKSGQGVEAIFSPPKEQRKARVIFGALALFAGISFIVLSMIIDQLPRLLGQPVTSFGSLEFASLGVLVLTCGLGIVISCIQRPHSPSPKAKTNDSPGPIPKTCSSEDSSTISSLPSSGLNLKLGLTAFLQGSILLALYTGLIEEYQSNPTMQTWVSSSIDSAQYLLNWETLLVSSFLVGVLVVYSLVTKDLVD